jgi:pullulanase
MIIKNLFKTFFILMAITLSTANSFAGSRSFYDSPARAIWVTENKILLTLPSNLNVNGVFFYFLKNSSSNIKIKLAVTNSYDRKLDLEVNSLNQLDLINLITGPLSLITTNADGDVLDETSVQLAGILDLRFFYPGDDLGINFNGNKDINLKLWSPTASDVQVYLYKQSTDQSPESTLSLKKDLQGVWQTSLNSNYKGYFYLYRVTVYAPGSKNSDINFVTDPYSKSLSQNSQKSQIVNVSDMELKPNAWDNLQKKITTNKVIYETHIRDLTANDAGVDPAERGTFLALTRPTSKARMHLKSLAENGLTHIHFLPLNDFASVNEDRSTWATIELNQEVPGASQEPQTALNKIRNIDNYNWGYDPYHYFVPDGSYSKNPDGPARIKELRTMVQSLNQIGLKTIIDVVFNHTYSSGSDSFSVLNKIVPLYYYRLNEFGNIYNSSCCSDTASENRMMEKLMVDAIVYWAKTYKVDGFRFDLMSFHTRSNILKIKEALSKLTLSKDGVNGKGIYLYGEGWNFGSLVEKNPAMAFTQLNSYGAGIGFFNDRFRDAIRGGTTDSTEKSDQGFLTGLYFDFNQEIANRNTPTDLSEQKNKLNYLEDVVKIGLAGNLRDFQFKNSNGSISIAKDYYFRGVPTGYAATTDETVNYVSAHDGYTLWDAISAKAPFYSNGRTPPLASTLEKQRMQQMALALTLFSQGVPFIEGGSEILRSKSGDVDSYDSGDWFNHLNFDYKTNNWGQGLPPSFKNYNDWSFWSPRLSDPNMLPSSKNILDNLKYFQAILKIRSESTLFNLKTTNDLADSLKYIDNEYKNFPGIIASHLKNASEEMIIIYNVNIDSTVFDHPLLASGWMLHPSLDQNTDSALKDVSFNNSSISIPGRSSVVLIPKGNKLK